MRIESEEFLARWCDERVHLAACTEDMSEAAATVLAEAFAADPGMDYIVGSGPDDVRRERIMSLCRYFIRYSRAIGVVNVAVRGTVVLGVSCLLPPSSMPVGLTTELAAGGWKLPYQLGMSACRKALSVSDALAKSHRSAMNGQRHWYLFQMAVTPAAQGQGVGRMLMGDLLGRADADGVACYLETFAARNVDYYQSHGFNLLGRTEIPTPGHAVPFWRLTRPVTLPKLAS